jgi:hypothetical protein
MIYFDSTINVICDLTFYIDKGISKKVIKSLVCNTLSVRYKIESIDIIDGNKMVFEINADNSAYNFVQDLENILNNYVKEKQ